LVRLGLGFLSDKPILERWGIRSTGLGVAASRARAIERVHPCSVARQSAAVPR
jgi:hypothetical protein